MQNNRQKIEMEKIEVVLYKKDQETQRIEITDEESETCTHKRERQPGASDSIRKLNLPDQQI